MAKRRRESKETSQQAGGGTPIGLQETSERPVRPDHPADAQGNVPHLETDRWGDNAYGAENQSSGAFTADEVGEPEQAMGAGADNPQGAQGARGPLGQEGQGNRQADQLAELESIEPDIELGPKDR